MNTTLEQYLEGGSIWGRISTLQSFPFLSDVTPERMDSMLVVSHGEQWMFQKLADKTIDSNALNIVAVYKDSWLKLVEIAALDIDVGSGNTRKQTETIVKKEVRKNQREDLNNVSAFNSDELIADTGATSAGSDDVDGDSKRVLTDSQISLANAFENLSLMQKSNILTTVNRDVASYLTLDIY